LFPVLFLEIRFFVSLQGSLFPFSMLVNSLVVSRVLPFSRLGDGDNTLSRPNLPLIFRKGPRAFGGVFFSVWTCRLPWCLSSFFLGPPVLRFFVSPSFFPPRKECPLFSPILPTAVEGGFQLPLLSFSENLPRPVRALYIVGCSSFFSPSLAFSFFFPLGRKVTTLPSQNLGFSSR